MKGKDRQLLHLSHLSDEEYLKHLWTCEEPSEETIESAHRIESLLANYDHLLEQVHAIASDTNRPADAQITRIRRLTERTRRREELRPH